MGSDWGGLEIHGAWLERCYSRSCDDTNAEFSWLSRVLIGVRDAFGDKGVSSECAMSQFDVLRRVRRMTVVVVEEVTM